MDIGFLVLGQMGSAMARHLIGAGHRVTVYNRSRDKAEALGEAGAAIADRPAVAARQPVVMTMLADDRAMESVVDGPDGILDALPPGGIHVAMSTISVALTRRLAEAHRQAGKPYVAAPVFGRPDAAASAKLFIAVAGPADAIDVVEPALRALSQRITRLGDDPAHAILVKIAGNFVLQSAIEALAEAIAMIRKADIDPTVFVDFLASTIFPAPPYRGYGMAIAEQRYEPAGFAIPLGLKDTKLALAAAELFGADLPLGALIRSRFEEALTRGWAPLDQAALGRLAAEKAGLG